MNDLHEKYTILNIKNTKTVTATDSIIKSTGAILFRLTLNKLHCSSRPLMIENKRKNRTGGHFLKKKN